MASRAQAPRAAGTPGDARVAVVTGGAGGAGRAIARAFHAAGHRVVLADVDEAGLDAARRDAFGDRGDHMAVRCDVSAQSDCERAVKAIVEVYGRIDALVNGAGLYRFNRTDDSDFRETYELLMRVNVQGVLNMTLAARTALEQSRGAIVNIASIETFLAGSSSIGYTVSKTAVAGLTRALAADLAPRGIRVNAVAPGIIDTPMVANLTRDERAGGRAKARIPLKRFASPEEIASVVLFLASPAASYMTGSVVVADGGYLLS